jgi:hypothetical protein
MASEALIIRQTRVSRDTPSIDALTIVAAFVRLRALDILFTPALAFAIVFKVRTSSLDHSRRTTFFLANFNSSFERGGLLTHEMIISISRALSHRLKSVQYARGDKGSEMIIGLSSASVLFAMSFVP